MTIISRSASAAGRNFRMMIFKRGLPSRSFSSEESLTSSLPASVMISSFLFALMESKILKMGSRINWLKARSRPPSLLLVHFLVLGLKKLSPYHACQSWFTLFVLTGELTYPKSLHHLGLVYAEFLGIF